MSRTKITIFILLQRRLRPRWSVSSWDRSRSHAQSSALSTLPRVCPEDRHSRGPVSRVTPATSQSAHSQGLQAPLPPIPRPPSISSTGRFTARPSHAYISWVAPSSPVWEHGLWISASITLADQHPGRVSLGILTQLIQGHHSKA